MFPLALSRLRDLPGYQRGIAIGLVTGLLPCGWLYAFVVSAAGTGSIVSGALLMTAFWLGSVPALVGVGGLAQLLSGKLRRRLPAFSALVLLFLGVMNLWTRYSNPAQLSEVARASAAEGPSVTSTALDDVPATPSCH
jgi:sulfite exporter TauE/SafE